MKKLIALVLLVCTLLTLVACSSTCEICGEEIEGKKYKAELASGKKVTACESCSKTMNSISDTYNRLFGN